MRAITTYTNFELYLESRKWLVREMVDGRERIQAERLYRECLRRDERIWSDALIDANSTASDVIHFELGMTNEIRHVTHMNGYNVEEISALLKDSAGASYTHPILKGIPPIYFNNTKEGEHAKFGVIEITGDSMTDIELFPGNEVLYFKTDKADDCEVVIARLDNNQIIKTYSIDNEGERWLYSESPKFPYPMRVGEYADFEIKGIVLRKLNPVISSRKRHLNGMYN